jgi:phosphoserine phosphatase RsbU/P
MESAVHILVVEDSPLQALHLRRLLEESGYLVQVAGDGLDALEQFSRRAFSILISDWTMPKMDGTELIRRIRSMDLPSYVYAILLTSKDQREDLLAGMESGADDFLTKPVDPAVLSVRLRAGERILRLERGLADRNRALEKTLGEMKRLGGLLPMCANCKNIRDDQGYWHQVESYIRDHSEADFTHGLCPACLEKLYPEIFPGKASAVHDNKARPEMPDAFLKGPQ